MSLWSLASNRSLWRGYDYYREGKVSSYEKVAEGVFESHIEGSGIDPYHTVIDVTHPRNSHCDCPFAEGRRVICKHMVALFFTVFPDEVAVLMQEVEESKREAERRQQEHYKELERYVKSLKKEDLQRELYNALLELEERKYEYW
jgi:uncharacterized Zn finger protein